MHRLLILTLACSSPSTKAPTNLATPERRSAEVVVQLAYRGTFFIGPPFSHLPPFTLLGDGTLIGTADGEPVFTTKLSPGEVDRIVQHVTDLGFAKLVSNEDTCKKSGNVRICTSDASFTIVRVGKREVITYADHSNEPAILDKIVTYLEKHGYPHTARYHPSVAVLHVQPQEAAPVANCAVIDRALLHVVDQTVWGFRVEGPELEALLKLAPANNASWFACADGAMYQLTLVPGVPGGDLDAELAVYRPRK